jgi:hypothetical protein
MRVLFSLAVLIVALCARALAGSEGDVSAAQLMAVLKHGQLIKETENKFRCDVGKPRNVSMYSLTNATFWTADMDIDCDGRETAFCNKNTDPDFQNQISCDTDISANDTPYFVIPIGAPANSKQRGIEFGQVAAILYKDQVAYAVFLDECGDRSLIGEASCATARILGIDPDPKNGGTDDPVTYIVFTGPTGRITDKKDYADHSKAVQIGVKRAKELIGQYEASSAQKP